MTIFQRNGRKVEKNWKLIDIVEVKNTSRQPPIVRNRVLRRGVLIPPEDDES